VAAGDGVVRLGRLLRSDAPVRLRDDGRAALCELGVRTAIDLRQAEEIALDPPDLDGLGIRLLNEPILGDDFGVDGVGTLDDLYRGIVERRGERIAAAVRILADPGTGPAIVFCSAGKDRTGIVSAILLGALDVADDDIIRDYTRTEENTDGEFRAAVTARAAAAGLNEQEIATKLGAPAAVMSGCLGWLRRGYGGAAGYLRRNGLSDRELYELRRALVQPG
jgi:protein-tyrosine phosphatase